MRILSDLSLLTAASPRSAGGSRGHDESVVLVLLPRTSGDFIAPHAARHLVHVLVVVQRPPQHDEEYDEDAAPASPAKQA